MRKIPPVTDNAAELDQAPATEPVAEPTEEPTPVVGINPAVVPADPAIAGMSFPVDRESLRRQVGSEGRKYIWPLNDQNPRTYMGVTSALNAIPKQSFLIPWAAKTVAETAVKKIDLLNAHIEADGADSAIRWLKGSPYASRDKAADIGTAVHLLAELDSNGLTSEADVVFNTLDPVGKNKARQVRAFFDHVPMEIDHVEGVVYDDAHGYAGTLDFLVTISNQKVIDSFPVDPSNIDGKLRLVLDLKTGKAVYSEVALQLAAYRFAQYLLDLRTGIRSPMPQVDGGAVLHVSETGWKLIPVAADEASFSAFLAALELSHHVPLGRELVGNPALTGKAQPIKAVIPKRKKATSKTAGDLRGLS